MFSPSCILRSRSAASLAIIISRQANKHRRSGVALSSAANENDDNNDGNNHDRHLQFHNPPQRKRRRTRRRRIQSLGEGDSAIPSLADFMHRAKVLKQYRSFVRLARFVDGKDAKKEIDAPGKCRASLEEVRSSFKTGMNKDMDALSRKMAISEGERRLRELEAMVGYVANDPSKQLSAHSPESFDKDSWINIQDTEDPRGRVGQQWPWERDED